MRKNTSNNTGMFGVVLKDNTGFLIDDYYGNTTQQEIEEQYMIDDFFEDNRREAQRVVKAMLEKNGTLHLYKKAQTKLRNLLQSKFTVE